MLKTHPAQLDAVRINADAFMALSKIGFSSIERLAALNLNMTRAVLQDGAASASKIQNKDHNSLPETVVHTATGYLQGIQEIAAETQNEVTTLISSYLSSQGKGANANAAWSKGFDMFNTFGQKIISMSSANTKAVADAVPVKMHA